RELVDIFCEILPDTRRTRHARLAPKSPIDTHLTGNVSNLVCKDRQGFDHFIDRVCKLCYLTFCVYRELLPEISDGHRCYHFCDAPHLTRQVGGHHVYAVGEVFPGPRDAMYFRLAAKFSIRAHLP